MNPGLHPRVAFDLRARRQVFGPDEVVEVPAGGEEFWGWYAATIRCGRPFRLRSVDGVPPYPPGDRGPVLWFSGGVESTYTLEQVRDRRPDRLSIHDHPVFEGPDRRVGQIHFLCAALASSFGYDEIFLGVERYDLLGHHPGARAFVERTPLFLDAWSRYQPQHRLVSVCRHLHKEEILAWLVEREIPITGTCDRLDGGRWCGDCYKCFEAFYTAKAVGLDLGIPLCRAAFERYHAEYRCFVDSGFVDNFNNAYQHYVRLQILHHLRFEPERDCLPRPAEEATA